MLKVSTTKCQPPGQALNPEGVTMTNILTATITEYNGLDLVDVINGLVGTPNVTVGGEVVAPRSTEPAKVWGNGTVSVRCTNRTVHGSKDVYFKVGQVLTVHI